MACSSKQPRTDTSGLPEKAQDGRIAGHPILVPPNTVDHPRPATKAVAINCLDGMNIYWAMRKSASKRFKNPESASQPPRNQHGYWGGVF
jgi:hypothetical protein